MERLGEVVREVVSPWIEEAQIKCISYIQSDLPGISLIGTCIMNV